jgi:hypothetical protein
MAEIIEHDNPCDGPPQLVAWAVASNAEPVIDVRADCHTCHRGGNADRDGFHDCADRVASCDLRSTSSENDQQGHRRFSRPTCVSNSHGAVAGMVQELHKNWYNR